MGNGQGPVGRNLVMQNQVNENVQQNEVAAVLPLLRENMLNPGEEPQQEEVHQGDEARHENIDEVVRENADPQEVEAEVEELIADEILNYGNKHRNERFSDICRQDPEYVSVWTRPRLGSSLFPPNHQAHKLVMYFDQQRR